VQPWAVGNQTLGVGQRDGNRGAPRRRSGADCPCGLIQKEAETDLEGKVEELRAKGLDQVISTAIGGDPASEIIDLAQKTPNNLIAMSSHGRSGIAQWVLGSVAEKVIHHSKDPVLMIRPAE
jgi:nucleotide-binding universal stress UspA family protein